MSKSTPPLVRQLLTGSMTLEEYFWTLVDIREHNECWEWKGNKRISGYGHFSIGDHFLRAHRLALIFSGIELDDKHVVMHRCDNRGCCNPNHLVAGTQQDNLNDMRCKGRGIDPPVMKGIDNPSCKITVDDVVYIRTSGLRGVDLATKFGIAQSTVSAIKKRKIWNHV